MPIKDDDIRELVNLEKGLLRDDINLRGTALNNLHIGQEKYKGLTDGNKYEFYQNIILPALKKGRVAIIEDPNVKGKRSNVFVFYSDLGNYSLPAKDVEDVYGHLIRDYFSENLENILTYYSDKRPDISYIVNTVKEHVSKRSDISSEEAEELLISGYIHEALMEFVFQNYRIQTSDLRGTKYAEFMENKIKLLKRELRKNPDLKDKFELLQRVILQENKDIPNFDYIFIKDYGDTGLIEFDRMYNSGIFKDMPEGQIVNLIGNFLDDEQFFKAIGPARLKTYISQLSKSSDSSKRELRYVLSHVPKNFILSNLLFTGELSIKEVQKNVDIQKSDIFALEQSMMALFLEKYKKEFGITDTDILNEYGKSLTGRDIIFLSRIVGTLPPERLIELSVNKSLEITGPERAITRDMFLDFYKAETLLDIKNRNKLSDEFARLFNENVIAGLDKDVAEEYFYNLVDDLKELSDSGIEFKNNLFDFYKLNILDGKYVKEFFDDEFLERTELDEKTLIKLFNDGIAPLDSIQKDMSKEELFKLIEQGLSPEALKSLSEEELADALIDEKVSFEDLMKVYLETDQISLETLKILIELAEVKEELSVYIDDNSRVEKVEELFSKLIISFQELTDLKDKQIIDEDTYNRLKETVDAKKFYEELEQTRVIHLDAQSDEVEVSHTGSRIKGSRKKQSNTDFELEADMIKELLYVEDIEKAAVIENKDDRGNTTSLDGYRVIPVEKYGLVILEKFEAENAMFIMPYQQAAFFFDKTNPQSKRKRVIREDMSQVKVVVHSANFAKNALDAVCELSDSARQELKPKRRYIEEARLYIDTMREKYDENKKRNERGE